MSWNEPGDRDDKSKKKEKDPWGRQGGADVPPNIDEALRQIQQKLRSLFGGREGPTGFSNKPPATNSRTFSFSIIGLIAFLIYVASGIFVVQPAEEAVILRFGRYVRTVGPGPHWIAHFIEAKKILNVQEIKTSKRGGPMLTRDENIVSAEIAVQYRISNARDYLFNVVDPERTLEQVSDSALRAVVGQSSLNEVLTSGRSEIGTEIRKQVQQNLNNYQSGLEISDLAVQQTKAPEEVKDAFDDAIKAQQDEEGLVNKSETYAQKVIPIAEGFAKRVLQEANGYKEKVILEAEGKTAKFAKILPEYQRSPRVTRERLFIDTLQEVYANTPKILIDTNNSNNLVYLPLDKLIDQQRSVSSQQPKEEETPVSLAEQHTNQSVASVPRRIFRPSYDDAERPTEGGE
ncbi:MAG: FtsH protease activity modulator HflK [Candidatus Berkiellales bacterium]